VYEFAKTAAQPYTALMILLGLAILWSWRTRQEGRRSLLAITLLWLAIYGISAPAAGGALLDLLRSQYPPPTELPAGVDAIVTLGGGIEPPVPLRDRLELDGVSYGRCLHAAAVYRRTDGCRVIVCGGLSQDAPDGPTVAEVMRDTLVTLGVAEADILVETRSTSTYENAVQAAELLRRENAETVLLVTDARHMPRSVLCFDKQQVDVVPMPSDFSYQEPPLPWYEAVLPSCDGLSATGQAVHEWIGMAWYWMHGRI
jgi:uncharacterized SAM-binding protein YcdF (DUF218 family)